jgi:hypothetical protein
MLTSAFGASIAHIVSLFAASPVSAAKTMCKPLAYLFQWLRFLSPYFVREMTDQPFRNSRYIVRL